MISDVFDKDAIKVLTLFSVSPGSKFTRNELKSKTFMNNVNLDNTINALVKNRFLVREKRFFRINFGNEHAKNIIALAREEHLRFKEIPLKIFYLITDFSAAASKERGLTQIYLFGSYSKLIYTEKSDVDIAVILKNSNRSAENQLKLLAHKLEKKFGASIELHFFVEIDLKQKDKLITEILRNGISFF